MGFSVTPPFVATADVVLVYFCGGEHLTSLYLVIVEFYRIRTYSTNLLYYYGKIVRFLLVCFAWVLYFYLA